MDVKLFTWDWKAQPDLESIARAVHAVSGGKVFMRELDTGGDFYAWIVSDHEVTSDDEVWSAHENYS